jgi:hypothetical protein
MSAVEHHPTITKSYGVDLERGDWKPLGVRGFRAHCPDCGALGPLRLWFTTAGADRDKHRDGRPFPTPRKKR